jgi:DNA-binding transcriptional ArsR family regulator/uncharacterized protein YndB with AHSA1/START domain
MQPFGCLFLCSPMAARQANENLDDVFKALADPSRRQLLDALNARNGQTLTELCSGLDMARQSVSKHLGVLEAAGLVATTWRGREKLHHLNAAPINAIAERWIDRYSRERVRALDDIKTALEAPTMSNEFTYTTFIATTPERLWQALTDPAFTERYWGTALESDWNTGSEVTWTIRGVRIADPEQVVLESDPYNRLVYTFHTFTDEFMEKLGFDDEIEAGLRAEKGRSKVSFDILQDGERVKLTVVHDGFPPDSTVVKLVNSGWPVVLSSLKTLLETGEPLVAGASS